MISERQRILSLVYASIGVINEMRANDDKLELGEDISLFGPESKLDSLGLVNLVIDIEQRLLDELGAEVILTDERVMSEDTNVFESVRILVEHISHALKEDTK